MYSPGIFGSVHLDAAIPPRGNEGSNMRVQEHISAHQRAKFCREFRRYAERQVRGRVAVIQLRRAVREQRQGVRS